LNLKGLYQLLGKTKASFPEHGKLAEGLLEPTIDLRILVSEAQGPFSDAAGLSLQAAGSG